VAAIESIGAIYQFAFQSTDSQHRLNERRLFMGKKVAVVLAGCGVYDGSEIQEAVLTLLALDRSGSSYQCFAPNIPQMHVINHATGDVAKDEVRNVLVEAARIA